MKTHTKIILSLMTLLLLIAATVTAKRPTPPEESNPLTPGAALAPSPITIDMATHNVGNIVTTIDNHGYIGGRQYYNEPSGEWPRNSGHDYIGEIMYWMGATLPAGDTVVANTWDEFQSIPSLISGQDEHSIMMSTDTSTYYDYNVADTIGAGYGNPALGWKIWDADSSDYVYRQNYSPSLGGTFPGGPLAVQESHYRFNDAAMGTSLMGLEITHSGLQWNYCYNEDFLFFVLEITNTSINDYADFAFGLYIDLDLGGPDGTGENGRLGDLVAVDSAENLAWNYESDRWDEGWGEEPGVMGTKFLETPDDIGVTSFRTGDFFLAPNTDEDRYAFITDTVFETSLPPTDQYYVQCVRGINLTAGKTVRVVWALIAGNDENDFRANAQRAQQFYDDFYVGAQPPITPTLKTIAGDGKVYLSWNDTSQTSIDPRSGEADFVGYKLYRSGDWGKTWGKPDYKATNPCLDVEYDAIGQWAVDDPMDPIPHTFIDTGLHNDREYWYALVAYDLGDDSAGVDALQSGFGIAGQAINVVKVTPRDDPAGLVALDNQVIHDTLAGAKPSDGKVYPIVYDRQALVGSNYHVFFTDEIDFTYWHLVNDSTGDTILADQDIYIGDPSTYEIIDGLQVVVREADRMPRSMGQTSFAGADTTMRILSENFFGGAVEHDYGVRFSNLHTRSNYEIRYTGDSTLASPWNYWGAMDYWVPFEVWNTDSNERVMLSVDDPDSSLTWETSEPLVIVNHAYDGVTDPYDVAWPYEFSWMFAFDTTGFAPQVGDIYTIEGAPLNGPDDVFNFSTNVNIDAGVASAGLEDIHVVPNPYFVRYSGLVERTADDNFLKFSGVPDVCTIRVYTLAGDLVRTLENPDGDGMVEWDLLSSNGQQVASGIYLYHVESPYGERLGRFAIIK